jgi:CheY-like chemotaxis protein
MKKILIVDDAPWGLVVLRQALAKPGVTVLEANSGLLAMDVHRREKVDLIVLDISLPDLDGEEVARRIRADPALRDVSILMFAEQPRETARPKCVAAGANEYISKPFQSAELQARVAWLLDVAARKDTRLLAQVEVKGADAAASSYVGRILNLSVTGCLLETEAPLAIGRALSVSFFVPGSQVQARATAKVVRRAMGQGQPKWGIRFSPLDDVGRRAVTDYVARLGHEKT